MLRRIFATIIMLASVCCSCTPAGVRHYTVKVVRELPHDKTSYTQGLFFHDGSLYESTGQYGESTFRKVDLATGAAMERLDFSDKYFVEGSVMLDGKLFILTWLEKVAFVYDAESLEYIESYSYPREGWGLTTDGKQLIASDGSSTIYFMDTKFKVQNKVTVTLEGRQVKLLNELEYIDGKIWANVYTTDTILIINPRSGVVEATVDCTGLLPYYLHDKDTDVLNGIAHDPATGSIYFTGKNWQRMFEVKLVENK